MTDNSDVHWLFSGGGRDGGQYHRMIVPDITAARATWIGLVCTLLSLLATGPLLACTPGLDSGSEERHDNIADWDDAPSFARLFRVTWPASARNVYYAEDVWFHYAYEVRVDMDGADAVSLLEAIPECETIDEIPDAFISADWWQVAAATEWRGCKTDPSVGWSNWIVADLSDAPNATVYLAHFQPDT